ncbi:MAG TPA: tetraacyldisaccharide 4'-kinase [Flavobacteriales bacterium]|nr:tetraacyldisaccharide 4'-kinase [Flavobacteriales bacterium]
MAALRLLLLPFSWLYGLVLRVRHALYDRGWLRSTAPGIPTINVGNIALGGTGKTPHVDLVLRTLLSGGGEAPVLATLSRGYGRQDTALQEVAVDDDASTAGDEPLMLKRRFTGVRVFVGADRVTALEAIQRQVPGLRAVVLDDALQHRAVRAGLNLVLTTQQRPWYKDHLLPAGNLRDLPYRARQADAVIVTKCAQAPGPAEELRCRQRLGLRRDQPLFFSGLEYEAPRLLAGGAEVPTGAHTAALLLTGIADPAPLVDHVHQLFGTVRHLAFGDHHVFTKAELEGVAQVFHSFAAGPKTLITTGKDAARLGEALQLPPLKDLPVAVVGIRAVILNEPYAFEALIRTYVTTHPAHR